MILIKKAKINKVRIRNDKNQVVCLVKEQDRRNELLENRKVIKQ